MDVDKSKQALLKKQAVETLKNPQSVLSEKNNETTRKLRAREISSRYASPVPRDGPRRFPSPSLARPATPSRQNVPKRAISAERKRSSTPPSPAKQSTPVLDTRLVSKKVLINKTPEGLWPSTMRSLSVSFQSDSFPVPVSKKEKPIRSSGSDRALRPSSNMTPKPAEITRKPTPERRRSPLKGKNPPDQSENSKPIDFVQSRLVEQHMWPSRAGGKLASGALTRSIDLSDKSTKSPSLRRMSIPDGTSRALEKSSSDAARLASLDECLHTEFGLYKPVPSRFLVKTNVSTAGARSQSLPTTPGGSRASSPSVSRCSSPSRSRMFSRGISPAHSRPSSPTRQSSSSTTSVLSFIADIKKGKKGANHIEDAHELRLLYNRHLQWRYANARASVLLYGQKVKAEKMLYNVWETTSQLWDFVIEKRNDLQQLRLRLKLHMVLKEQMACLEVWSLCEKDHATTLSHAVEDLRSSILRLPITGGAKGDIETVRAAVCSAVDVMQAMGSSISSVLERVEGMNSLVSELADLVSQGRAMIGGCEALLASIQALQVEEYSLRNHLIQMKEN